VVIKITVSLHYLEQKRTIFLVLNTKNFDINNTYRNNGHRIKNVKISLKLPRCLRRRNKTRRRELNRTGTISTGMRLVRRKKELPVVICFWEIRA